MTNEICNDKREGGRGNAGPEIIRKKSFKMYIPNFFSSNKYTINVNVTFMHLIIKQVMHVEFNLINIYR